MFGDFGQTNGPHFRRTLYRIAYYTSSYVTAIYLVLF